MFCTKTAVKRKIKDDQIPIQLDNPSKIRRLEKLPNENLNQEPSSTNEAYPSVAFNSDESASTTTGRKKLSSILHFEKKYKYYCKKHNVLYLIENTRRKGRENSRKNRDNLVSSFRSLALTKNTTITTHLSRSHQLPVNMRDEFNDASKDSLNESISKSYMPNCKISKIFVAFDENEVDSYIEEFKELTKHVESDDSESDEGYTEEDYESSKEEDYILTRSPGGTRAIMRSIENSNLANIFEHCSCYRNYSRLNRLHNNLYNYDSSSEEDNDF